MFCICMFSLNSQEHISSILQNQAVIKRARFGNFKTNQIINYQVSQKKFKRLAGCYIKSMGPIFKTGLLIYQSKANLDDKILFDKITHHLDLELEKCL